jgi:hypothetical protein
VSRVRVVITIKQNFDYQKTIMGRTAPATDVNEYEELRKLRILENSRRMQVRTARISHAADKLLMDVILIGFALW